MAVDLQLALALPLAINRSPLLDLNTSSSYSDDNESFASSKLFRSPMNKKRSFQDSSDSDSASTETPARNLLWNKQPKDDDDRPNAGKTCNLALIRNGDEREGIVGWPPIQTFRRKQRGHRNRGVVNGLYVKAQIEGVLITRKIDLNRHRSFEALASAVLFMFGRGHESVAGYNLTYQDREGDWLLATDLPWRAFLESVQRLKLMRKEE